MIVYGTAANLAVLPEIRGSLPNLRRHNAALIIAAGGPPALSSSGRKLRPSVGSIPRMRRKLADTRAAFSASGASPLDSDIFSVRTVKAPTSVKDRAAERIASNRTDVAPSDIRTSRSG